MKQEFLLQATKYGFVGILNTLLTAVTIWIMMYPVFQAGKEGDVSPLIITISNLTGFIVGLINSFLWNRKWTFRSKNNWRSDFIRFVLSFLICYIPQLFLVNLLNKYITGSGFSFVQGNNTFDISAAYICQLIGIVFYTSSNFLLNKYYTFKQ